MPVTKAYWLGRRDYEEVWRSMRSFTEQRDDQSDNQIWFLEHPAVFTQGQAGKPEHLLSPGDIPVVASDRGGQVTYHGPGQLVVYPLIHLKHLRHGKGMGIRSLVSALEAAMISCLQKYDIEAKADPEAPGVYVEGEKIGSIGLRVRKQACYHGISLNIDMDMEPFQRINPCGYQDLKMTQLKKLGGPGQLKSVARDLHAELASKLGIELEDLQEWHATTLPVDAFNDE